MGKASAKSYRTHLKAAQKILKQQIGDAYTDLITSNGKASVIKKKKEKLQGLKADYSKISK